MRLSKAILLALIVVSGCMPVIAQENITFANTDGMFTATSGPPSTLSLANSQLTDISGFMGNLSGFNTTGTNLGTVSFTTGALMSGSLAPLTGQTANFGSGGMFNIMSTVGGGFTFSGTFTSATWSCVTGLSCSSTHGTWSFVGTVMNATLTINGQTYSVPGAVSIQLTTVNGAVTHSGNTFKFTDSGGQTNFNVVTPEPNTLALFGGGLLVLGFVAKSDLFRRLGRSKS